MRVGELRRNWRGLGVMGGMSRDRREMRKWRKMWRGLAELDADDRADVGRGSKGGVAKLWQLGLGN